MCGIKYKGQKQKIIQIFKYYEGRHNEKIE